MGSVCEPLHFVKLTEHLEGTRRVNLNLPPFITHSNKSSYANFYVYNHLEGTRTSPPTLALFGQIFSMTTTKRNISTPGSLRRVDS